MSRVERTVEIHAPLERVFDFVTDIRNHGRVSPPDTHEELLDAGETPMCVGTVVRLRARYGGIRWILASRITRLEPPGSVHAGSAYFRDEQIQGPFARWEHDHWFLTMPDGSTRLTDRFTFAAPAGPIGRLVEWLWLNRRMHSLLEHMQTAEKQLLEGENS